MILFFRKFTLFAWVLVILDGDAQVSSGEGLTPLESVLIPQKLNC